MLVLALWGAAPDASTPVDGPPPPAQPAPPSTPKRYALALLAVGIGALMGVAHRKRKKGKGRRRRR